MEFNDTITFGFRHSIAQRETLAITRGNNLPGYSAVVKHSKGHFPMAYGYLIIYSIDK